LLISHREHCVGLGASVISMDRAIAPGFVLRRVILRELAQDERLTAQLLGAHLPRRRRSLAIVLGGFLKACVDDKELHVSTGHMVVAPEGTIRAGLCAGDVLELDWEPGVLDESMPEATVVRLGASAFAAARELADALKTAQHDAELGDSVSAFQPALAANGLVFAPEALHAPTSAEDQILHTIIDRQLSSLDTSPMMVDMDALGISRRTLTRRISEMQARYRLPGGESWRKVRDHYRLVVASVLLSHQEATPRTVAAQVGYGSVEALHHAFRNAEMPSPASFRRMLRAA
jgi:AraC-like DNA-binding protein